MILQDDDGDSLEVKEVFGLGKPTLLVRVIQEREEAGMVIDREQARALATVLTDWAMTGK